jgi:hypothetical protein
LRTIHRGNRAFQRRIRGNCSFSRQKMTCPFILASRTLGRRGTTGTILWTRQLISGWKGWNPARRERVIDGVILGRRPSGIVLVSARHENHHPLPRTGEEHAIGVDGILAPSALQSTSGFRLPSRSRKAARHPTCRTARKIEILRWSRPFGQFGGGVKLST